MKKLIFLTVCIMHSIIGMAQQIELGDAASMKKPHGMNILSKDKISSFNKKKFRDTLAIGIINNAAQTYTIDDILISLNYQKGLIGGDDYLLKLKESLVSGHRDNSDYTVRLVVVNGKTFVITSRKSSYLLFYFLWR